MTRYADPHRCPDCRGPIVHGAATCPSCGLLLTGKTALDLFSVLTRADTLLATLRAASTPQPAAAAPATAAPLDLAPMPVQH
ncbi:MAG: hypothetical protein HOQ22_00205, partial [Nocardioidaceae bacterium]|nr:hypothetical protein [Nocardioidaceae bacterium]